MDSAERERGIIAAKKTIQAGFVRFLITGDDSDNETVVAMTS